jgi:hypothetical protein
VTGLAPGNRSCNELPPGVLPGNAGLLGKFVALEEELVNTVTADRRLAIRFGGLAAGRRGSISSAPTGATLVVAPRVTSCNGGNHARTVDCGRHARAYRRRSVFADVAGASGPRSASDAYTNLRPGTATGFVPTIIASNPPPSGTIAVGLIRSGTGPPQVLGGPPGSGGGQGGGAPWYRPIRCTSHPDRNRLIATGARQCRPPRRVA